MGCETENCLDAFCVKDHPTSVKNEENQEKEKAVVHIQSAFRGHIARKQMQKNNNSTEEKPIAPEEHKIESDNLVDESNFKSNIEGEESEVETNDKETKETEPQAHVTDDTNKDSSSSSESSSDEEVVEKHTIPTSAPNLVDDATPVEIEPSPPKTESPTQETKGDSIEPESTEGDPESTITGDTLPDAVQPDTGNEIQPGNGTASPVPILTRTTENLGSTSSLTSVSGDEESEQ